MLLYLLVARQIDCLLTYTSKSNSGALQIAIEFAILCELVPGRNIPWMSNQQYNSTGQVRKCASMRCNCLILFRTLAMARSQMFHKWLWENSSYKGRASNSGITQQCHIKLGTGALKALAINIPRTELCILERNPSQAMTKRNSSTVSVH